MSDYVVMDFPTIMDGYVVSWYADEAAADAHRSLASASRNGVVTRGDVPTPLRDDLNRVHEQVRDWYAHGCRPSEPHPWADVLTHRMPLFGELTPLRSTSEEPS